MNLAIFTYSITYTSSAIWTHISVILKSQKIVLYLLVCKVKYHRSCPGCSMPLTEFFEKIARNFKLPLIGETQIEVSEKTSRGESGVLDCVRFCALTTFTESAVLHRRVAHICPFSA